MSIAKFFVGQRGVRGADGIDAVGVGDIDIPAPISELLAPNALGLNSLFSREEEATILNRYGFVDYSPPAVTTQSIYVSNDMSNAAFWADPDNTWTLDSQSELAPDGTPTANGVTVSNQSGTRGFVTSINTVGGGIYRVSFYIKVVSGTVNGVTVFFFGFEPVPMTFDPEFSGWQRVTATISARSTAQFNNIYFSLDTGSAVVHLWQFNGTEGGKLYDVIPSNGTIQTIENKGFRLRQNQQGTLIEGETRNLATFSESLDRWTVLGVASVAPYQDPDIFGETGKLIQLDAQQATQFTLLNSLDVSAGEPTEGDLVYVSFYARLLAGSIGAVSVSMTGSETSEPVEIEGAELKRYFAAVPYGTDPDVQIEFTGASGVSLVIEALQVEADGFSSYVPSGAVYGARSAEIVKAPFNLLAPNTSQPWSVLFSVSSLQTTERKKALLSSTLRLFEIFAQGQDLTVKAGQIVTFSDAFTGDADTADFAVTHDGATLSLYRDGQLSQSIPAALSVTIDQDVYIGSNNGAESADCFLSYVRVFDVALSADQLTYFSNRVPTL